MEDEKFKELLKSIVELQQKVYLLPKENACTIIDKFLIKHPELLQIHDKEWYYKNL